MKKEQKKSVSIRIVIIGIIFGFMFAIIGIRAVWLQIFQHTNLSKKAAREYQSYIKIIGQRGTIYDKNGIEMAVTTDEASISANPYKIENKNKTAVDIGKILNISQKKIFKKLNSKKKFIWIKRQVEPKKTENIKNLEISGIGFSREHTRFYPNKALAGQLIGLSGLNGKGLEGIEFYYHNYLQGKVKKITGKKDGKKKWFNFNVEKNFVSNNTIYCRESSGKSR